MGQAIGGIIGFAIILMFVAIIGAFALIVVIVALGVLLLFVTKSRRPLIKRSSAASAMLEACELSSAITVGLILASFATLAMLSFWDAFSARSVFYENMGSYSGLGVALFAYSWLGTDAFKFFLITAVSLFVANRVSALRENFGLRVMAALPPLIAGIALLISYTSDGMFIGLHLDSIWEDMMTLFSKSLEPYAAVYDSLFEGRDGVQRAVRALIETDGSLFQLSKHLVPLMLVLSVGFVVFPNIANDP